MFVFFYVTWHNPDLHVLTHAFPTRRSTYLAYQFAQWRAPGVLHDPDTALVPAHAGGGEDRGVHPGLRQHRRQADAELLRGSGEALRQAGHRRGRRRLTVAPTPGRLVRG